MHELFNKNPAIHVIQLVEELHLWQGLKQFKQKPLLEYFSDGQEFTQLFWSSKSGNEQAVQFADEIEHVKQDNEQFKHFDNYWYVPFGQDE